jgi:hypothetical protein
MLMLVLAHLTGFAHAADLLSMAKPADSAEWGYIDASGEMVIEAKYRKCFPFSEDGYAPIYDKKRKSWVFIDAKGGELAAEPEPLLLKSVMGFGAIGFTDDRAPFRDKKSKMWGYIGIDGSVAIQPAYEEVTRFVDGHAVARKGENAYVILDTSGTETPVSVEGLVDVKRFSEGLAPFKLESGEHGFVDTSGAVVVKPTFKSVGYLTEGRAWVKTMEGTVGFIDGTGNLVVKPTYAAAKDFNSGFARVKAGEDWTFIDKSGKDAGIDPGADAVKDFSEGLARGKKGDKWGFFDPNGAWAIEPAYENVRDFKNGYAAARQGDTWGFIDTTGAWAVKPTFDGIRDLERTSE